MTIAPQILKNYPDLNEAQRRLIQTEVDVSLEKDGYILIGKVDLLMGQDNKLELLNFKTSERSTDPALLATYKDQLCTYAHVLERRQGAGAAFSRGLGAVRPVHRPGQGPYFRSHRPP